MNDKKIEEDKILELLEMTECWDGWTYGAFYELRSCALSKDIEQTVALAQEVCEFNLQFVPGINDIELYAKHELETNKNKDCIDFIYLQKYGENLFERQIYIFSA